MTRPGRFTFVLVTAALLLGARDGRAQTGQWQQLMYATPGPRMGARMIYDEVRKRVVLFGHWEPDLFEWDGASRRWDRRVTTNEPFPYNGVGLAYDSGRARYVLFGGDNSGTHTDELWELDTAAGTWTQLTPAGPRPSARYQTRLAYDPDRRTVWVYGGQIGNRYVGELWEWDGAAGKWTDWTATAPLTDPVYGHLVYDVARKRLVLAAGISQGSTVWERQPTGPWTTVNVTSAPSGGNVAAAVYDPMRARTTLFTEAWEVMEWDGTGVVTARGGLPPGATPRYLWSGAAFDPERRRFVLYGGSGPGLRDDTWEWDPEAGQWAVGQPSVPGPGPVRYGAMAYDSRRDRLIQFGGTYGTSDATTWEWQPGQTSWGEMNVKARPQARTFPAMAFDGSIGRVLVFGGRSLSPAQDLADLHELDGDQMTWIERAIGGTQPPARSTPAMAYLPDRKTVIMSGGRLETDVWEWDGTAGRWTEHNQSQSQGERPRLGTGNINDNVHLTYDPARKRVVAVVPHVPEVWDYDPENRTWRRRDPGGAAPPPRIFSTVARDTARNRLVMYGGARPVDTRSLDDLWEWDDEVGRWSEVTIPGARPRARNGALMAFDDKRGRLVVYGGFDSRGQSWASFTDLWSLTITGVAPRPDAAPPEPDAAPPLPDAAAPEPDVAAPEPDAAVDARPPPDGPGRPPLDAAVDAPQIVTDAASAADARSSLDAGAGPTDAATAPDPGVEDAAPSDDAPTSPTTDAAAPAVVTAGRGLYGGGPFSCAMVPRSADAPWLLLAPALALVLARRRRRRPITSP